MSHYLIDRYGASTNTKRPNKFAMIEVTKYMK